MQVCIFLRQYSFEFIKFKVLTKYILKWTPVSLRHVLKVTSSVITNKENENVT
jgi:hypothetical protein